MADPITYLGAAASIAGIIDVLSRSITLVSRLSEQWKDSQLAFINLQTQLQALSGALGQIRVWVESSEASDSHHQLTMDLDSIILCCESLVSRLNSHLESLARDSAGQLKTLGKLKLIMGGRNINEIQKMVEKQAIALHLLLQACNCNALLEQKRLLEQKSTRAVFRKVGRDSASLVVLRDASSYRSVVSDTLSKLSWVFGFDQELRSSTVYDRAWRNNLRKSRYHEEASKLVVAPPKGQQRKGEVPGNRGLNIVLLGPSDCSKTTLLKQMQLIWGEDIEHSKARRNEFKQIIFTNMCELVGALGDEVDSESSTFSPQVQGYIQDLKQSVTELNGLHGSEGLPRSALRPFSELWSNADWREWLSRSPDRNIILSYFMANIDRIFSPSYIPSHQDIMNARVRTTGIAEEVFHFDGYIYHVFDVGGERPERRKWIHLFDKKEIDIVLFQVALGTYDCTLSENHNVNQLVEALAVFDSVINSYWCTKSTVLLNFTKADIFEQKIKLGLTMPPEDVFPCEGDSTDVIAVRDMITKRFTELDHRERKNLVISYIDARDTEQARKLLEGVHTCARDQFLPTAVIGRLRAKSL